MPMDSGAPPAGSTRDFEEHEQAFFDEEHSLAAAHGPEDFRDLDEGAPRRGFFRRLLDGFARRNP